MKIYRRCQIIILAFFCLSIVVGITGTFTSRREIFPLFSWFLFSLVPGKSTGYDILIKEVQGRPVTPALPYRQATQFFSSGHSVVIYRAIQELGKAVKENDEDAVKVLRTSIEKFFYMKPVQYDLVKIHFQNPLQRWRTQEQPLQSQLVKSFVTLNLPPQ